MIAQIGERLVSVAEQSDPAEDATGDGNVDDGGAAEARSCDSHSSEDDGDSTFDTPVPLGA